MKNYILYPNLSGVGNFAEFILSASKAKNAAIALAKASIFNVARWKNKKGKISNHFGLGMFSIFLFFFCQMSFAQVDTVRPKLLPPAPEAPLAELPGKPVFNNFVDTVYVEVGAYEDKSILHRVEKGHTMYGIGKFYGLNSLDMQYHNVLSGGLKEGQLLRVPIATQSIVRERPENYVDSQYVKVVYRVRKGENLFRIAKTYFGMSMDSLKTRNSLENDILSLNQELLIGWLPLSGVEAISFKYTGISASLWNINLRYKERYIKDFARKKESEQSGIAYWKKDNSGAGMYALHRTAKVGSVIRIHNPMNERVLYVKVIGKIPDSAYSNNIVVIVTPTVAKALGALDPEFYTKVRYLR